MRLSPQNIETHLSLNISYSYIHIFNDGLKVFYWLQNLKKHCLWGICKNSQEFSVFTLKWNLNVNTKVAEYWEYWIKSWKTTNHHIEVEITKCKLASQRSTWQLISQQYILLMNVELYWMELTARLEVAFFMLIESNNTIIPFLCFCFLKLWTSNAGNITWESSAFMMA